MLQTQDTCAETKAPAPPLERPGPNEFSCGSNLHSEKRSHTCRCLWMPMRGSGEVLTWAEVVPALYMSSPFGSLVRILNEMEPVRGASHEGRTCTQTHTFHISTRWCRWGRTHTRVCSSSLLRGWVGESSESTDNLEATSGAKFEYASAVVIWKRSRYLLLLVEFNGKMPAGGVIKVELAAGHFAKLECWFAGEFCRVSPENCFAS